MWRGGFAILLMCAALMSALAQASCTILDRKPVSRIFFAPPALVVSSDAEPGTVIYTESHSSQTIRVECTAVGNIWQGYTVLTAADERPDNPLQGVYQTTVPGIGVRAAWANQITPKFEPGSIIRPWHMGISKVRKEDGYYALTFNAVLQFVVTGPMASGILNISKFNADWQYDDTMVAQFRTPPAIWWKSILLCRSRILTSAN